MSNQISAFIDPTSFVFSTSQPGSTDNVFLALISPSISLLLVFLVDSFKKAAIRRFDFCGIHADGVLTEN
jgi:hypothetical protein